MLDAGLDDHIANLAVRHHADENLSALSQRADIRRLRQINNLDIYRPSVPARSMHQRAKHTRLRALLPQASDLGGELVELVLGAPGDDPAQIVGKVGGDVLCRQGASVSCRSEEDDVILA